jgi:hypothetical protein
MPDERGEDLHLRWKQIPGQTRWLLIPRQRMEGTSDEFSGLRTDPMDPDVSTEVAEACKTEI